MMKDFFHIHTYRCGHAENVPDEAYVIKALEYGAKSITFTDHCPYPGDLFFNRMRMEDLPEYISSLKELKHKYKDQLDVKIGLEAEYLPSFTGYLLELKQNPDIDLLMLGQNFWEVAPQDYPREEFSFNYNFPYQTEYINLMEAQIEGVHSGLFDVVAHPDRAFRGNTHFLTRAKTLSTELFKAAAKHNVALEKNFSSRRYPNYYRPEFWECALPKTQIIEGIDAHSIAELELYAKYISGERLPVPGKPHYELFEPIKFYTNVDGKTIPHIGLIAQINSFGTPENPFEPSYKIWALAGKNKNFLKATEPCLFHDIPETQIWDVYQAELKENEDLISYLKDTVSLVL